MIKSLREVNSYGSTYFLRAFSTRNWTRRGLDNLLAKTDRTGSINRVEGSGHRARVTVTFLERQMPDFIPSTLWPPNSPVDYSIWILLQGKVYHSRIITDLEELKTRLGGLTDE